MTKKEIIALFKEWWKGNYSISYEDLSISQDAFVYAYLKASKKEWIKVEDRLPEDQIGVIVVRSPTKEQLSMEDGYSPIIMSAIDSVAGSWYDFNDGEDIDTRYFNITHWMPLPELPID
jgi:hypothetical protein